MNTADAFRDFLSNLAVKNSDVIGTRYGELTCALNKKFRDTESKTANTLQVGSYGRWTAINGISDLDMLYIMPSSEWDNYKDNRQLQLLRDTKSAILARYPKTSVRVDRLVVTVTYADFHIEVQPVFEQNDGSFKYPDTEYENYWPVTKPKDEISQVSLIDSAKNKNLRRLCKMVRAWKNKHGVGMGGLLVDTLVHNFLQSTEEYDSRSFRYYDFIGRDFFKYLSELNEQDYYAAVGSGQRVNVKKKFQPKAKKAYKLCLKAIEAKDTKGANSKWKKIYGRPFPEAQEELAEKRDFVANAVWTDTEQYIENQYSLDIRWEMRIDCEVKQSGFRDGLLRVMLAARMPLLANKKLKFWVKSCDVPAPFEIYWKVLNRGDVAMRRNCIRGQIVIDSGNHEKSESTNFSGDHVVECYAVKDGVVVAKDRIHVPISNP